MGYRYQFVTLAGSFVGAGYFDDVTQTITGGHSSLTAMHGSTEEEQFEQHDARRPGLAGTTKPRIRRGRASSRSTSAHRRTGSASP
jgi:hypothetical protein